MFYKSFKEKWPPMEDDLKILNVLYFSNHCLDHDLWVLRGKLEENSDEISSVVLLSPACYLGCFQINIFLFCLANCYLSNLTFDKFHLLSFLLTLSKECFGLVSSLQSRFRSIWHNLVLSVWELCVWAMKYYFLSFKFDDTLNHEKCDS